MSYICVCEMNVDRMPTKLNLICNVGPSQGKWQAINRLWPLSTGWGGCYGLSPPLPDLGCIWVCFDCYQPGPKVWVAGWYLCSFMHVEHAILLMVKSLRWSAYVACPSPTLNMVWLLPQFELVKSFHMKFFVLIGRKLRSDFSVANWLNSGVTCVMYLFPSVVGSPTKNFQILSITVSTKLWSLQKIYSSLEGCQIQNCSQCFSLVTFLLEVFHTKKD